MSFAAPEPWVLSLMLETLRCCCLPFHTGGLSFPPRPCCAPGSRRELVFLFLVPSIQILSGVWMPLRAGRRLCVLPVSHAAHCPLPTPGSSFVICACAPGSVIFCSLPPGLCKCTGMEAVISVFSQVPDGTWVVPGAIFAVQWQCGNHSVTEFLQRLYAGLPCAPAFNSNGLTWLEEV